jgi:hypothetical protein
MWVVHLQREGFTVTSYDVSDRQLNAIKAQYRIPRQIWTCHTAIVDGYLIEGHVPASAVARVLKERPSIVGIGVPGMPIGSPGMPGARPQDYTVYAFDKAGQLEVFELVTP